MPDDRLRLSAMAREEGVHRNTLRNWIKQGRLKKYRDGTVSRHRVQQLRDGQSIGRPPGKRERRKPTFRNVSKCEKNLVRPFGQSHGLRNLRRLMWCLPVVANELGWSAKKKQSYATVLRDAANTIWPITRGDEPPSGARLLERRERERKRLTDASHSRITKRTGVVIFQQASPATEPGWEIVPFGITKKDERYVLLDALDPTEFLKRAKECGYEFTVEQGDPTVRRAHPLEEHYTPDFASQIDSQDDPESVTDDILVKYKSITDPVQKETFLQKNQRAIWQARMERAKPTNWEHLLNIAERAKGKGWKWIKIDDGYGFKAVPARTSATNYQVKRKSGSR